jgi:hypothetical protein
VEYIVRPRRIPDTLGPNKTARPNPAKKAKLAVRTMYVTGRLVTVSLTRFQSRRGAESIIYLPQHRESGRGQTFTGAERSRHRQPQRDELGEATLVFRDQPRLKLPLAIARHVDREWAVVGQRLCSTRTDLGGGARGPSLQEGSARRPARARRRAVQPERDRTAEPRPFPSLPVGAAACGRRAQAQLNLAAMVDRYFMHLALRLMCRIFT